MLGESKIIRMSIVRAKSNMQSELKQALIPHKRRRSSIIELSNHYNMQTLRSKLKQQAIFQKQSRISQHPLSFVSYQKQQPQQFKSNQQANAFIYINYDILDLSYSLVTSQINLPLLFVLNLIMVLVRYSSLFCLAYVSITTEQTRWQWVFCIIITYVTYFICMIKVSLRPAENKSQAILKLVFDSLQSNEVVEYFQIIKIDKLFQSILRALIPPQFSFLFILSSSRMKRAEIYSTINYIYASIQAVMYYPFFVIYTFIYFKQTLAKIPYSVYMIVMGSIIISEAIFICLSLYLVCFGCKKRGFMQQNKKNE